MNRWKGCCLLLCVFLFNQPFHVAESDPLSWVEDSFEDFADGELDAAGQNIYVSRDGSIRTIHRFDLNQDGYLDLIFNSTHDTRSFLQPTLCLIGSDGTIRQSALAVEGSTRVALDDFNRNGHMDAAFCPNDSGLQNPRRFLTLLWGREDGWSASRSNGLLPVHGARAVVSADLNHDTWPDLVVLNDTAWLPRQPSGKIVRIYWGSTDGFLLTKFKDIGIAGAIDLAGAGFNNDGGKDVAVLTGNSTLSLLWAKPSGEPGEEPRQSELVLPVRGANCVTAGGLSSARREVPPKGARHERFSSGGTTDRYPGWCEAATAAEPWGRAAVVGRAGCPQPAAAAGWNAHTTAR